MVEFLWQHNRCILCLQERELTLEHVIPQQIGGLLTARFLCKPCNDAPGHTIELDVRSDPSIRLAAENLRGQIPDLADAIRDKQPYVVSGPGGTIRGSFKGSRFQIHAATRDDESVVQPTADAPQHLRKILAKRGIGQSEIEERLAKFDSAPDDALVDLAVSVQAVRWSVDEIQPVLEGPLVSSAVLGKIAYEFLACHDGDLVLAESPQLALKFYRDVLGLTFLFNAGPNPAFLDAEGVRLMLSTPQGAGEVGKNSILYFVVSDIAHADEEADADDFTVFDVESALLAGAIVEKQKDRGTGEPKYVIEGETTDGRPIRVVAKFGASGRIV